MQSFSNFVSDQQPRHNLHMTHLDEALFEGGTQAANDSIDALTALAEGTDDYFITTKWDGAPSIFCGTDPSDGKFFVGTKSVFNKNPKLYKESWDIIENEPAGKAQKLVEALKWLQHLSIPADTVLQGDLLWTSGDHRYVTHESKRYVTVHPNTLMYGWLAESDEGKAVRNAQLGIVFHTTYRGQNDLSNYQATFGADVSKLRKLPEVWVDDAYFKGKDIQVSPDVVQRIQEHAMQARECVSNFDKIVEVMNTLPSSQVGANIKTFYNSNIREGVYPAPNVAYEQYIDYLKSYWNKNVFAKLKTEDAMDRRKVQLTQLMHDIHNNKNIFESAFNYVETINAAKHQLINELNNATDQKIFVELDGQIIEAQHEGYVAINKRTGNAVKLVDRLDFSYNNFSESVKKGWQRL